MSLLSSKPRALERVRYFPRQLMTAEDMRAEQDYFLERMRRHNRMLHGWGIVGGLQVQPAATADKPWQVRICPGFGLSPQGDEIHVPVPVLFDLARPAGDDNEDCMPRPCPPGPSAAAGATEATTVYVAIRYNERLARPVRTGHSACSCGEHGCENTRHRDDFALTLLDTLPVPYDEDSQSREQSWLIKVEHEIVNYSSLFGLPTPDVGGLEPDRWLLLAAIEGDRSKAPPAAADGDDLNKTLENRFKADRIRRLVPRVQDLLGIALRSVT